MAYIGCLGHVAGNFLFGWAYNDSDPDERVEVEVYQIAADGLPVVLGSVVADQHRPDLLDLQYGDGDHGFSYFIPDQLRDQNTHPLYARFAANQQSLTLSPIWLKQGAEFAVVAGDIVNNCNLRCPFCVVDYSGVSGLKLMSEETLKQALALLTMVPDGQFWLSCLHEPTLHPRFIEFVELVPIHLRQKISFTTNLCHKLSDDTLARLANSGVHNIRVSFDSTDPEVFARLRQNGKYEVFSHNLERLVRYLKQSDRRPLLRFITMAFKDNLQEIPDLIKRCQEDYEADRNEIRFTYFMPHLESWLPPHLLTADEWATLEANIAALPGSYQIDLAKPPETYYESTEPVEALFGGPYPVQPTVTEDSPVCDALLDQGRVLRLRWDGALVLQGVAEATFRVDLNQLRSPETFFKRSQGFLQVEAAEQAIVQQSALQSLEAALKQSQVTLIATQATLTETQAALTATQVLIKAMETSKFWRLRQLWFRVRKVLRLT